MQIQWHIPAGVSPYLFARRSSVRGLDVRHFRVRSGELVDQTRLTHEINVTIAGQVRAARQTPASRAPGAVCVVPAGERLHGWWRGELECLAISVDPALVTRAALEMGASPSFELRPVAQIKDPLLGPLGLAMLDAALAGGQTQKLYAEALANTLILHLLQNYGTAGRTVGRSGGGLTGYRLRRAMEYIDAHLDDDLTLADIAAAAGLSQFHFARAFRRSTGLTPQQYVTQRRIELAKRLLQDRDIPLVEVSLQAGFKNQSHFTTLFKKATSLTPKVWRDARSSQA
ncbi:MAG: helix-turn-helix domain-containing protein [Pyrinomonadaceae bacterium]